LAKNSTGQRGRGTPASQRKPVTIDLSAESVKKDENAAQAAASAEPSEKANPEDVEAEAAAAPKATPKAAEPVGTKAAAESEPKQKSEPKSPRAAAASAAAGGASAAGKGGDREEAKGGDRETAAKPSTPSAFATAGRQTSETSAAKPANRGSSIVSLFIAAIVGGAVVALVVVVLALRGFFAPQQEEGPDLAGEIETLKSDVAKLNQAPAEDDLAPLREQLLALQQSVSKLQSAESDASSGTSNAAVLRDVQSRLAQLEANANQAAGGAVSDEAGQRLAAQLTALSGEVAALKKATPDLSGLESGLSDLRQQVAALSTELKKVPSEERVASIETQLSDMGKKVDLAAALGPAVAADALAAAVDAGRPFASELAALSALGVDSDAIAALQPNAEKGLPTLDEIRSRFETEVASIDLTTPIPEGTGALDRLLQSARGLVEVRPSNPTAGADPSAIVTRIRAALAAGDLKTALAEWNTLPDEIKTKSVDWAETVKTRVAVDDLVAQLRSSALSRLDTKG
jgi:hypothetical protein